MTKLFSKKDFKDNCGFGLIANIKGNPSHNIVKDSIKALKSMTHRGAIGADGKTGDGCGLLLDIDKDFFRASERNPLCGNPKKIKDDLGWQNTKNLNYIIEEMIQDELKRIKVEKKYEKK